jgi:hypothetical protein
MPSLPPRAPLAAALLTAALIALAPAGLAEAQPLAEVARREQERRKVVPAAPKVYTNEDLGAPPPPRPAPDTTPAPEVTPAAPPETAVVEEQKDEAYWRGRIIDAQQQLQRSQMFLEALQSRINALSADFVARDDPAQRAVIAEDRQKALAEMERVKADIQRLTKQIADIREEARRAGVPPGWLR